MVGAALGFLWYNAHPAQVFMGDVGSLALGGAIGMRRGADQEGAPARRSSAACSSLEALSVIIQVASFKLTGKRVFRMAPLHHHFELSGLGGAEDHRALLDPLDPLRAALAFDPETAMSTLRPPWTAGEVRRALVYGLGLSGKAAAQLLRARGVEVVGDARRPANWRSPMLATDAGFSLLAGGEAAPLPAVDLVVLSPGVPATKPLLAAARSRGIPVIAEVELAFPFVRGPIAAITGSNGKSTTTALTGALLAAAGQQVEVCGNIGTPLSARVDGPAGRSFVVELSSFQLETTDTFHPRAAALLNLSPDHLDRYPAMDDYAAAKRRIFLRQGPDDVAVLNADDPQVAATVVAARRRYFSTAARVEDGCFVDGETVVEAEPGRTPRIPAPTCRSPACTTSRTRWPPRSWPAPSAPAGGDPRRTA